MPILSKKSILAISMFLLLCCLFAITACSTDTPVKVTENAGQPTTQPDKEEGNKEEAPAENNETVPSIQEPDPPSIDVLWQSGSHAATYVTDLNGENNTCAQCHAPGNWQPSMDDLPESCYTCKFELEDPPPYITETDWVNIPCNVCHKSDKKGNLEPEIYWLEIPVLEEYVTVGSPSELCSKCHNPMDEPMHGSSLVGGAHSDYECTDCHNAHDATASCSSNDCHPAVVDGSDPKVGHDEDHAKVACEACHDGAGMEVGPTDETGIWMTFSSWSVESEEGISTGLVPYSSHNIKLETDCLRCHFAENPWGLTSDIELP